MKLEIRKIGPKEAMKLLEKNSANRSFKKIHLAWITQQMIEGKWKEETGETIKIAKSGKLLDGQHRLTGVVKSGKTFNFSVASDLEEDVFTVIDAGVARSGGDALHAIGVQNAFNISAFIRVYYLIKEKDFTGGRDVKRINSEDIVRIYQSDSLGWQVHNTKSVHFYISFSRTLPASFLGGWYKYLSEYESSSLIDKFFNKLCSGIDIKTTIDPVGVYRNWLIDLKYNRMRQSVYDRHGYFIVAWNAFAKGEKFRKISWDPAKNSIPEIYFPSHSNKKNKKTASA